MSAGQFVIRPMCSADVERVLEIARSLKNTPHWPRSAYLAALDDQAQPRRIALVAAGSADNFPVGFAIASLILPGAELETIAVSADRQRRGLGRALLDGLVETLRQEGAKDIWLEVRVSNHPAMELYCRSGFVENGYRNSYYADPVEDASVMRLTMP